VDQWQNEEAFFVEADEDVSPEVIAHALNLYRVILCQVMEDD
jgi:hypothetical protein